MKRASEVFNNRPLEPRPTERIGVNAFSGSAAAECGNYVAGPAWALFAAASAPKNVYGGPDFALEGYHVAHHPTFERAFALERQADARLFSPHFHRAIHTEGCFFIHGVARWKRWLIVPANEARTTSADILLGPRAVTLHVRNCPTCCRPSSKVSLHERETGMLQALRCEPIVEVSTAAIPALR